MAGTLVYGIGFNTGGKHKTRINKIIQKPYQVWYSIFRRCFDPKYQTEAYAKTSVEPIWHSFQNFAEWFNENYIDGWELDKDILVKGNKVYGPDTCCFVPKEVNNLMITSPSKRGIYPIGVSYCNTYKQFVSSCQTTLGQQKKYFPNSELAFEYYKLLRENYIIEIAEKWKSKLPAIVYNSLINYKVEITD
jgi:hypothetical protein